MQKIVDLDALVGDAKRVKLRGKTYTLPPDLPVELWLRLQRQAQSTDPGDNQHAVESLYTQLLELFQDPHYGDPSIKTLPIGMGQLIGAIGQIYSDPGDSEPVGERPTKPRAASRAGTTSTSPRPRKRSR